MNTYSGNKDSQARSVRSGFGAVAIGLFAALCAMQAPAVEIAQSPMFVGSDVPGNLVLVPSVEYPTLISQANIGSYDGSRRYSGYFDPNKCYLYNYSSNEPDRYFYPTGAASSFNCPTDKQWSGNYMNWAATQTIDPFRSGLTGGYRVVDTPTTTILEKARHHGSGLFPNRVISNATSVKNLTGATWNSLTVKIEGLGNRMRFSSSGDLNGTPTAYDPSKHTLTQSGKNSDPGVVYEVSVRVKVCDASVGVETNCVRYSEGWKPEGLIQEYSKRITYSIFGFLNQSGNQRNGGVLRARQKFVGPSTHYPEQGILDNARREWDPTTGVLVRNPNPADAAATAATGIVDS